VTDVLYGRVTAHLEPQSISTGADGVETDVTLPIAPAADVVASVRTNSLTANAAWTVVGASSFTTTGLALLVTSPVHAEKTEEGSALAVNETATFRSNFALQVPGQFIPGGDDVTAPVPVPPSIATVRVN
jgi:hypothetical protein